MAAGPGDKVLVRTALGAMPLALEVYRAVAGQRSTLPTGGDWLAQRRKLRVQGPDVDLRLSVAGRRWPPFSLTRRPNRFNRQPIFNQNFGHVVGHPFVSLWGLDGVGGQEKFAFGHPFRPIELQERHCHPAYRRQRHNVGSFQAKMVCPALTARVE